MRQHHTFWQTGGTGRVNQRRDTLRNVGVNRLGYHCVVESADSNWSQATRILNRRAMPLCMLSRVMRHAGRVDYPARTTMRPDLIDLARREARVHQYGPCVDFGKGQQNRHRGTAILADNHHPVARTHAGLEEPNGCILDRGSQLLVTPLSGGLNQCQSVRRTLHPMSQDVARALGECYQDFGDFVGSH